MIAAQTAITVPLLVWLGSARVAGILVDILVWAAIAALCLAWLHGTRTGATVFALGTNPLASRLSADTLKDRPEIAADQWPAKAPAA